jgi:hypothetical protein
MTVAKHSKVSIKLLKNHEMRGPKAVLWSTESKRHGNNHL